MLRLLEQLFWYLAKSWEFVLSSPQTISATCTCTTPLKRAGPTCRVPCTDSRPREGIATALRGWGKSSLCMAARSAQVRCRALPPLHVCKLQSVFQALADSKSISARPFSNLQDSASDSPQRLQCGSTTCTRMNRPRKPGKIARIRSRERRPPTGPTTS